VTVAPAVRPAFAHASEAELARILDFYQVLWRYEPDTYPIGWNLDGDVVESFSPDFYLPDMELYVELTTLKQKLVRKKNRKLRRLRELYPDIRIKLFYARDFRMLMLKFGRMALLDDMTGTTGQSTPPRIPAPAPGPARRAREGRTRDHRLVPRSNPRGGTVDPPMTRTADLQADIGEVMLSEEVIAAKVAELGRRIGEDYAGRNLTLVSVLKGSLPFMADLMRQIPLPLRIDLMEVSSYGGTSTESSGLVRIMKDLSASIADEDVLLVEDIIDTGLTLNYLVRYLRGKNPASLRICTLLDKPARRLVEIPVDYVGFEIPDQFVVGYGLDFGERYRNLRFVGVLRPEVYSSSD
jgi:bifunctional protein TilS/HprT